MLRLHALIPAAGLLLLGACATTAPNPAATVDRIDIDSYRLLAEIAMADQQYADAAQNYLEASLRSDDPALAERTAFIAEEFGLDTVGHRAVARWREIEPDAQLADYFAGIFELRSGRVGASVDEFSALLGQLTSAELGRGFGLVLEALGDEPDVGAAAEVMLQLNRRFPGTPQGHYGLAQLALRAGAFDLALRESQAAIDLVAEWPEAQLLHARTLLLAGRSDEALELASELADEYDNTAVRLQFAEILLSAGESERASRLLDDILARNPGMPEVIRAQAFLALSDGDLDLARERFEMLRANPDYRDETFYYLGRIAELESDFLQATRAYSRVTEGGRAVEAQIRVASILYQEMNDPEAALRQLREFGNSSPRFAPEMLLARARVLLDMDRAEEAVALIDAAIGDDGAIANQDLKNAQISFYSILMENSLDKGDVESAQRWVDEGLTRYPGNPDLRYSEARLLQEQGRMRKAVGMLEDLVDESPDDPQYLNALGYLLTDKLNRHNEARGYIQRALAMSPDSGAILDSMGWVLFRLGEYDLALDYLERAYRALEVTEVLAHIVEVQYARGNETLALQMLDEGLTANPGDSYLNDVDQRLRP